LAQFFQANNQLAEFLFVFSYKFLFIFAIKFEIIVYKSVLFYYPTLPRKKSFNWLEKLINTKTGTWNRGGVIRSPAHFFLTCMDLPNLEKYKLGTFDSVGSLPQPALILPKNTKKKL